MKSSGEYEDEMRRIAQVSTSKHQCYPNGQLKLELDLLLSLSSSLYSSSCTLTSLSGFPDNANLEDISAGSSHHWSADPRSHSEGNSAQDDDDSYVDDNDPDNEQ